MSQGTRLVRDEAGLAELAHDAGYAAGWEALASLAGEAPAADGYLVEEAVEGRECTLEGYVHDGRVTVIGVTDSIFYPGTGSFERFEYPSSLPPARLAELSALAGRLLPAHGFDDGFFNVELRVPEDGPAKVIEINGRIASQFSPLVEAVHGVPTYRLLLELACGDDPGWSPGEPRGVAISYAVRLFEDALVGAVPEPEPGPRALRRARGCGSRSSGRRTTPRATGSRSSTNGRRPERRRSSAAACARARCWTRWSSRTARPARP